MNRIPFRRFVNATSILLFLTLYLPALKVLADIDHKPISLTEKSKLILAQPLPTPLSPASTIGDVRKGLEGLLLSLRSAVPSASADAAKLIDQLDGNIVNIIKEIDERYSKNLDKTITSLDNTEKQFFRHTEETIVLSTKSVSTLSTQISEDTIKVLRESNISAYDALHALPCRDKIPRIVYVEPSQIEIGKDSPVIKMRGNFLDIGTKQEVQVNNQKIKIKSNSSNEVVIEIPSQIIASISKPELVTVSFLTNKLAARLILGFCNKKIVQNDSPLSTSVSLLPQISYRLDGFIEAKSTQIIPEKKELQEQEFPQPEVLVREEDCDANILRTQQVQIPSDWEVKDVRNTITSANGGSQIERIIWSGSTVTVDSRIVGKGYTDLFIGRDCNGRGWVSYQLTIIGQKTTTIPSQSIVHNMPRHDFTVTGEPGQATFAGIRYPQGSDSLPNLEWDYLVTIHPLRGTQELPIVQLNSTNGTLKLSKPKYSQTWLCERQIHRYGH